MYNISLILFFFLYKIIQVVLEWFCNNGIIISTKASDEAILQNIYYWGYGLLEKLVCSYKILRKLSWKI